ncbi:MAG TPA: hypothetical protein VMH87_15545 [Pseudomonadales bacterium]|nr:hypothetical protein [Pseudomonadales bacterium]
MEPERKIEKWLKAYARKRRTQAGEPFNLHPATRQLLQSEIARVKPKPDDDDESVSLWEVIRQQWAILLSFAVFIFLFGIILLPVAYHAKKRAELATTSGASAAKAPATGSDKLTESFYALTDTNPARTDLADLQSNETLLAANEREFATNGIPSSGSMTVTPSAAPGVSGSIRASPLEVLPAPITPPPPALAEENTVARQPESSIAVSNSLSGAYASQPTPPPMMVSAAPSGNFPSGQAEQRLQEAMPAAMPSAEFQTAYKNSVMPLPASPVLASFRVQQNGNSIRLVDQDGSVYDGSLQLGNGQANTTKDQTGMNLDGHAMQNAAAQIYFFHVYGTNLTTKQTVAFTGSLTGDFTSTNSTKLAFEPATHSGNAGGGGGNFDRAKAGETNQLAQLPWAELRITGTAVVNRTNRIEINAAPVTPNGP